MDASVRERCRAQISNDRLALHGTVSIPIVKLNAWNGVPEGSFRYESH